MTSHPKYNSAFTSASFSLGRINILPSQNTLICDETTITLEPRIMAVLCLLAERAPEVVTREELISGIWRTDQVADDSVNQAVSALRKSLQQADGTKKHIQTVPKRGYRLVTAVEKPTAESAPPPDTPAKTTRRGPLTWLVAGAVAFGLVALLGFSVITTEQAPSESLDQTQSVAVLPFASISQNENDNFFAAGMHEALLTSLQKVKSLRVTSRTSSLQFADSTLSIPKIASTLGVTWIIEGTVVRDGSQVRINAKLIDGNTDTQVWAEQYERQADEILALQNDVATSIAKAIHIELSNDEQARLTDDRSVNLKAYSAYVRGLYHFDRITPADFERSVENFEKAIALEPDFPLPYAAWVVAHGIAVEYGWRSRADTRTAVEAAAATAMRLGSDDGEAHHAMASLAFHYDRDFVTAEREFKRAIDLNHDAYTYFSYGWLLSQQGRHEEAVNALQQAVELDPRSPAMHTDLGWWLYGSRNYEQAMAEANKALEIFDQHPEAYWLLAAAESALGQHNKAIRLFDRYESLYGSPVHWFRGYLHALSGDQPAALDAATDLDRHIVQQQALPIDAALIHVALGDKERALTIIEQSEDASVSFQPYLWPEYELLWNEPRFRSAVTRFGLPQPPEPHR